MPGVQRQELRRAAAMKVAQRRNKQKCAAAKGGG
jgi:hypothetical protein